MFVQFAQKKKKNCRWYTNDSACLWYVSIWSAHSDCSVTSPISSARTLSAACIVLELSIAASLANHILFATGCPSSWIHGLESKYDWIVEDNVLIGKLPASRSNQNQNVTRKRLNCKRLEFFFFLHWTKNHAKNGANRAKKANDQKSNNFACKHDDILIDAPKMRYLQFYKQKTNFSGKIANVKFYSFLNHSHRHTQWWTIFSILFIEMMHRDAGDFVWNELLF